MKTRHVLSVAFTVAVLWSAPLWAAVRLVPTVPGGLSSPLFVGHAHDGSNRLFTVEQGGLIKVLQPGSSTPTVYRGSLGALESGSCVYGDYCSGEIFTWNGAQSLLLDTTMGVSSFGEDEQGELYVVDLNRSSSRIAADCTTAITPTGQAFVESGGTDSVAVTATDGCAWTAASSASWIHITAGSSGNGNGIVQYTVDANTSTSARTASITIAGHTYSVTQTGATASCTFAITPTTASFPLAGGNGIVTVTAPTGCAWGAVTGESWITLTGGASGSGDGTVTYSVAPYTDKPKNRKGTVIIAGATLTVKQPR